MKKNYLDQQRERWELLIERGKQAGRDRDLPSVVEYFEAAYKVSRHFSKRDRIRQQSAYFLGYAKFTSSDKRGAIKYLDEFLNHPESANENEKELAEARMLMGHCYWGSENDKAFEHFEKAREIKQQLGQPTVEVDTMLGSIKMLKEDYSGAIPFYKSAYDTQKKENGEAAQVLSVQLAYAHKELGDTSGETKWQKENLKWRAPKTTFLSEGLELKIRDDVPTGWGKDSLSHFLEVSQQSELATFEEKSDKYKQLQTINDRFLGNRQNLILSIMPTILEHYDDVEFDQLTLEHKDWLELFFYLRTQAAFVGASKLALSAQIPETYMLLRGVLENAMYGFYIWKNPDKKEIWLARDDSPEAKQLVKNTFKVSYNYDAISSVDSALRDDVYKLYNDTIDKGAHPNVKTFIDNAVQKNEDGALSLAVTFLNRDQQDKLLDDVIATGDLVFRLFKAMYPDLID